MQRVFFIFLVAFGLPILSCLYWLVSLPGAAADRIFLSISTFVFSIFTGFFISRQAGRFNRVRETVTAFDGRMSAIYRASGLVSDDLQKYYKSVIKSHYKKILDSREWNIHFMKKSSTVTKLSNALLVYVKEDDVTKVSNQALGSIVKNLAGCQELRKQMVALNEERIPLEQWILIVLFLGVLIMTISAVPSAGDIFSSILKASFVISTVSVVYILHKLNRLAYSEKIMGERSALDVLEILSNKK